MAEKRKLIRIEGRGSGGGGYGFDNMNFAFVSNPSLGRKQISATMTCREYVNRTVWGAAIGKNVGQYCPESDLPFDFSRLRLLIVQDAKDVESFKRNLFNGKAALNLLESLNNWKRSTITTVIHSNYKHAWLLTGPEEWVSQPQLLSLCTWILRLASHSGPLDVDSYDALESCLFNIQKNNTDGTSDKHSYCRLFWDKMYILVKYHKTIFAGVGHQEAWMVRDTEHFGIYSGFSSFCNKDANYSKHVIAAQKRFSELCGKHLPRTNLLIKRR